MLFGQGRNVLELVKTMDVGKGS
jgi:hypothetical protein